MIIENAAVFVGRTRRNKGVNVEFDSDSVVVQNRITGVEIARYSVVEVATEGMAWDVTDEDGTLRRLVAQQGCGCSGMKSYKVGPNYSGALSG